MGSIGIRNRRHESIQPDPNPHHPKPHRTINLHANRLESFTPPSPRTPLLPHLLSLNLSSTALRAFRCPNCPLPSLRHLDLSANLIETLQGFPALPQLRVLLLPFNRLRGLEGLPALPGTHSIHWPLLMERAQKPIYT